jgi:PPM family protein phosphatase
MAESDTAWPSAPPRSPEEAQEQLFAAVQYASTCLLDAASMHPGDHPMSATVVAVLVFGDVACLAHVGASRIYRVRAGRCEQMTEDHTVANKLIAQGVAAELAQSVQAFLGDQAPTRTLGTTPTVAITGRLERIQPGDRFLLTSDAFHNDMTLVDLAAGLSHQHRVDAELSGLLGRAKEKGGPENRTGILLRWRR